MARFWVGSRLDETISATTLLIMFKTHTSIYTHTRKHKNTHVLKLIRVYLSISTLLLYHKHPSVEWLTIYQSFDMIYSLKTRRSYYSKCTLNTNQHDTAFLRFPQFPDFAVFYFSFQQYFSSYITLEISIRPTESIKIHSLLFFCFCFGKRFLQLSAYEVYHHLNVTSLSSRMRRRLVSIFWIFILTKGGMVVLRRFVQIHAHARARARAHTHTRTHQHAHERRSQIELLDGPPILLWPRHCKVCSLPLCTPLREPRVRGEFDYLPR